MKIKLRSVMPLSYYQLGNLFTNFRRFCARNIIDYLGDNAKFESGAKLNEGVRIGTNPLLEKIIKYLKERILEIE